jgi:hypothetical protein
MVVPVPDGRCGSHQTHRVEGNRRAARNGPVSDPPPEIPNVTIRNSYRRIMRTSHCVSLTVSRTVSLTVSHCVSLTVSLTVSHCVSLTVSLTVSLAGLTNSLPHRTVSD